jgi:hypothetical protein
MTCTPHKKVSIIISLLGVTTLALCVWNAQSNFTTRNLPGYSSKLNIVILALAFCAVTMTIVALKYPKRIIEDAVIVALIVLIFSQFAFRAGTSGL